MFSEYSQKLLTWKSAAQCCTAANHPTFEIFEVTRLRILSLFNQCEQMLGADFLNCLNGHLKISRCRCAIRSENRRPCENVRVIKVLLKQNEDHLD
jgi:hypothetical protein